MYFISAHYARSDRRYESTGKELFVEHAFCYSVIKKGLYLMVWGYFKKLVIADRLSAFVTAVIGSAGNYEGYIFLIAGILYSIQIYCDFQDVWISYGEHRNVWGSR